MVDTVQCVCKLPIEGRNRMCIVKTEWDENSCTIYLLLGNEVWIGSLWEEDVLQLSANLSLSPEEYFSKTKHALTYHGGAVNFVYTIDGDKFCWKMRTSSGMSIKYGSVALRSAQVSDVVESIIDSELDTNIQLNDELKILRKQKEELESEKLILSEKLEEMCELKTEMENTLYSKFLTILNEKKKKIRELKEKFKLGEEYEEEDEDDNKKVSRQAVVSSDVSDHLASDTDMETDNEMETSQTDMMFGSIEKQKEIPRRKHKYSEEPPVADEANENVAAAAGPSGVKVSKSAVVVKVTKAVEDNGKYDVTTSSKTSASRSDHVSHSNVKNSSLKSKNIFSQDTQKIDLSAEELLKRLID